MTGVQTCALPIYPGDNFAGEDVETALAELASKSSESVFTTNGTLTGDRKVFHNNFNLNLNDNTLVIRDRKSVV